MLKKEEEHYDKTTKTTKATKSSTTKATTSTSITTTKLLTPSRLTNLTKKMFLDVEIERIVDAGDLILMPGLVDSHVHVNEPGNKISSHSLTLHTIDTCNLLKRLIEYIMPEAKKCHNFKNMLKSD